MPGKIALVGFGKIAGEKHLPALQSSPDWELCAAVEPSGDVHGIDSYLTLQELIENRPDISALSFCTPPIGRLEGVKTAIEAGLHVMLEKPPAASMSDARQIAKWAEGSSVTVFTAWHSTQAPQVEAARRWISSQSVRAAKVRWLENFNSFHLGQEWIWKDGGFGVFDAGINAFSILELLFPGQLSFECGKLDVPIDCETPIRAHLILNGKDNFKIDTELDWSHQGKPVWSIEVIGEDGSILLFDGGAALLVNGHQTLATNSSMDEHSEYSRLYRRFSTLVTMKQSEVDLRPLQLAEQCLSGSSRSICSPINCIDD